MNTDSVFPNPPRLAAVNAAVWVAIAGAVTAQQLLLSQWDNESFRAALVGRLVMLPFWAAATPWILRSAHRWPFRGERSGRHALNHLLVATAFIATSNAVIRAPILALEGGARFADSLLHGLGLFGPIALVVYVAILAIGSAIRTERPVDLPSRPEPAIETTVQPAVLTLREGDVLRVIPVDEVELVEADDNYIRVSAAGKVVRARGRLSDVEELLDPVRFLRIHRSAIVAATAIRAVVSVSHGDWAVELADGTRVRVARGRRQLLAPFRRTHGEPAIEA